MDIINQIKFKYINFNKHLKDQNNDIEIKYNDNQNNNKNDDNQNNNKYVIHITSEYEEFILCVNSPNKITKYKLDDNYINQTYFNIENDETILEYFKDIADNKIFIEVINGINASCPYYHCDYCGFNMSNDYFYCFHCYSDMCHLCHSEINEEIAIKNGAKKYKEREEYIKNCHEKNMLINRNYMSILGFYINCDTCGYKFLLNDYAYRKITSTNTYDVCLKCYEKDEIKNKIDSDKEFKLILLKDLLYINYKEFGSILNWFPVLSDKNKNYVLINVNPDDINYNKICLAYNKDNDNIYYYYTCHSNITINDIINELNIIINNNTTDNNDSYSDEMDPIQILMKKYKMNINH